jgi:hypothetical protein
MAPIFNLRLRWRSLFLFASASILFLTYHILDARISLRESASYGAGSNLGLEESSSFKSIGANYTKMLVVAATKDEDVSWIASSFEESDGIQATVYKADDPSAPFHPPQNKGHEVMIYLTYIIDQYDNLADVNIFVHSHRYAWHNNELLDHDAVQIVTSLSAEHVQRQGYMNTRCHWDPGCPEWLHPDAIEANVNKLEEKVLADAWSELFPSEPLPTVLAQPCCAQFAVSKDRIQQLPKARYEFFRNWLLQTQLTDYLSGRVWEYLWHYLFTRQNIYCPAEHVCYCQGFGICFEGAEQYTAWWDKMWDKRILEDQLKDWYFRRDARIAAEEEGRLDDLKRLEVPEVGKDEELEKKIAELDTWLQMMKWKATIKGNIERNIAGKLRAS